MSRRLVVVGGDAGGMSAAATARRRAPADALEVVVLERGGTTSYSACGIPYLVGGVVRDADTLIARSTEEHRRNGIDVRLRHEAVAVDLEARTVTARDLDAGTEAALAFDGLVLATGARPRRPELPGIDAAGIHGVQHLEDGVALRRVIDAGGLTTAVIVGAGYIGIEMAEALLSRGLKVTVVDRAPQPMATLDPDMGALVGDAMRRMGITLRLSADVSAFVADAGHVRAVVVDGEEVPADVVVLGLGVVPNGRLGAAAGLVVGESGGITIDDHARTSAPGVYAAGDCVETYHRVSRRPGAFALGTHANKQGRVAGINLTGGDATFKGVLGTAVSRLCSLEVGRTGLTEGEAAAAGFSAFAVTVDAATRAGYFPGAESIRVKLVVEAGSGRLLGAQVVGKEGSAKRVDVFAACLWNEMAVDEIVELDLGYAPPFAPLWDPVLVAARAAVHEMYGEDPPT